MTPFSLAHANVQIGAPDWQLSGGLMRSFFVCVAMALTSSLFGDEPDADHVKKLLKSENYKVTWGTAPIFEAEAKLEIGFGSGHGFALTWLRFQPGKERVDVLSIKLDEGRTPYESKWPPDRAPVAVKHAQMKPDAYAALLRDLAVVEAAKLQRIEGNSSSSSNDFWVNTRLMSKKKTLINLDWAGYEGSDKEVDFAKPQAAVALARAAIKELDFKNHSLSEEERGWASTKFARDWKKFKDLDFYWWVKERYAIMIGVVGDSTAIPTLRDILEGDPKNRCVYYAINAITRLTKKDVREKPVEEMDVEKTRQKVIDSLRDGK
jgi:hypothetical protein